MSTYSIRTATFDDINAIAALAEKIWWQVYPIIISTEQIQYMLDTIYDAESLKQAMAAGSQEFLLLEEDGQPVGFASFGPRPEEPAIHKLHKIYILPEKHGRGLGKMLILEITSRLSTRGFSILDLNVNRDNPALSFYEKLGFKTIREEDIPIGPYWMNDYVMRLQF